MDNKKNIILVIVAIVVVVAVGFVCFKAFSNDSSGEKPTPGGNTTPGVTNPDKPEPVEPEKELPTTPVPDVKNGKKLICGVTTEDKVYSEEYIVVFVDGKFHSLSASTNERVIESEKENYKSEFNKTVDELKKEYAKLGMTLTSKIDGVDFTMYVTGSADKMAKNDDTFYPIFSQGYEASKKALTDMGYICE